ncbi:acyltransferase [Kaistella haifensis]|nr:acyltransferase [Kaistella haifensis]
MRNFLFYTRILINFFRYKFFFKKSKKFLIDFNSSVYGANMMCLGQSFAAKKGLRIEAFALGDKEKTKIEIGDYVSFGESVHVGAINKITFGNNVLLGSRIIIVDHNHGKYNGDMQSSPLEPPSKRVLHSAGEIHIEDNVWIGDGVTVLANVKIGKGAIIAANTVVNKNIEANSIVGGNPIRTLKKFNFSTEEWE